MNKLRVCRVSPSSEKDIIAECFIETCAAIIKLNFLDSVHRYGEENVILDKCQGFSVYDPNHQNNLYSFYMEPLQPTTP